MEFESTEIKKLRARMGWCQSELAYKLSVTIETIRDWELGILNPTLEQCKHLENFFIKSELSTLDMLSSAEYDAEDSKF